MFPTKLDGYPTFSSNISFHTNLKIHYMDMTDPQKQEHRLMHSHTTHSNQIWVTHLIVEI